MAFLVEVEPIRRMRSLNDHRAEEQLPSRESLLPREGLCILCLPLLQPLPIEHVLTAQKVYHEEVLHKQRLDNHVNPVHEQSRRLTYGRLRAW
jgi:hypothetical protein